MIPAVFELLIWAYVLGVLVWNLHEWPANYTILMKVVRNLVCGAATIVVFVKVVEAFDTLSALIGSVPL